MSNIGIAANLFQPSGKCLKCRHWNPATKDFMGNGMGGYCRLAYCKNSRLHVSAMIINIIQRGDGYETDTNSRSRLLGGRTLFETLMFI